MSGMKSTKTQSPASQNMDEEKAFLLTDDRTLSDIESDSGRVELESKFRSTASAKSWLAAVGTCAGNSLSRSMCWKTAIARIALFLLPSFVPLRLPGLPSRDARRSCRADRASPTAYLDGMRGVAALAVFFCHYFYTSFRIAEGYGFGDNNYNFMKLPVIRLWYQGPPMVCVFFVISGYALSLKPLKLARAAAAPRSLTSNPSPTEAFSATMSSFVFRRFFRLFLPTAASTFLVVILLRIGAYDWTRDFAHNKDFMRNVQETHPERLATTSAQLWDWARAMFAFVHVWDWLPFGGSTAYDVHLWTIPVEFRCSLVLFLTIIGVARLRTAIRLLVLVLLALFCYRSDRWEMLLFYSGTVLAELDLIRKAHSDPTTNAAAPPASASLPTVSPASPALLRPPTRDNHGSTEGGRSRPLRKLLWSAISILSLYLMSQPDFGSEDTPGWVYLTSQIPEWWADKYRYWQTIGAILFVAAVGRVPVWQRLFNTSPAQYLGRISYAIYLMHGPVLHTVGYAVEARSWEAVRAAKDGGEARYLAGFMLGSLFIVPIVVWAADVFWRAVDAPVVKFSKWLESVCSVSSE